MTSKVVISNKDEVIRLIKSSLENLELKRKLDEADCLHHFTMEYVSRLWFKLFGGKIDSEVIKDYYSRSFGGALHSKWDEFLFDKNPCYFSDRLKLTLLLVAVNRQEVGKVELDIDSYLTILRNQ